MNIKMAMNTYLSMIESKTKYTDKQNRNRFIDTESILTVVRWEGVGGPDGRGAGMKKYSSVVTEQSRGCKVQHRKPCQ